ncbi:MAG TPA: hypothetical protein VF316_00445 [Polyangiaceae bacterium]
MSRRRALRTAAPVLLLMLAAAGCDKKNAAAGSVASTTPSASASPVELGPLTGPLTSERIFASKNAVKPFDDWDKAYPRLREGERRAVARRRPPGLHDHTGEEVAAFL